jgi:hypothetical protein
MSLSFWTGCWEILGHDGLGRMDIPGWESACGFSSRACLRADETTEIFDGSQTIQSRSAARDRCNC